MRVAPVVAGAGTLALYLATLASQHPPDAMAYAGMVERGELPMAGHLLTNHVGALAVSFAPTADPMTVLQVTSAVAGALAVALLTATVDRATGRSGVALALGLAGAVSYGPWSLCVTWEAHALALAVLMGLLYAVVAGASATRQGLLLGAAGLLHLVSAMAAPGIALASLVDEGWWRRLGTLALVSAAVVIAGYVLVLGGGPIDPLGEAPGGGTPLAERLEQLHHAAVRAWVYVGPERCGDGSAAAGFLREGVADIILAVLAVAAGIASIAGRPWRQHLPATLATAGWLIVAIPLVSWFEPGNYEYLAGPSLAALALTGLGLSGLPAWARWPLLAVLVGGLSTLGAQNLVGDALPASRGQSHERCLPTGPASPEVHKVKPGHSRGAEP